MYGIALVLLYGGQALVSGGLCVLWLGGIVVQLVLGIKLIVGII